MLTPSRAQSEQNLKKYMIKSSQAYSDEDTVEGLTNTPARFVTKQDRRLSGPIFSVALEKTTDCDNRFHQ